MKRSVNPLWVEKFRPTSVAECILPKDIKDVFQKSVDNHVLLNTLVSGSPGTGKTSVLKAAVTELKADFIFINGSLKGNIDTLRNEIQEFASSVSFSGGRKYVILDECLEENTEIWIMRNGIISMVQIKSLDQDNDLVMSYNFDLGRVEWLPFSLENKGLRDAIEIEFENGETVICTPNHKWYVLNEKGNTIEVYASDLYKYMHVLTESD